MTPPTTNSLTPSIMALLQTRLQPDQPGSGGQFRSVPDPRIHGLTGSIESVSAMAKDRYIFFENVPMEGGNYQMEHQASIQPVDAQGQFGTLVSEEGIDVRLAKGRRLIGS